jgi:hypothetical protein
MVEAEPLGTLEDETGWTVLATTVSGEGCTDAAILEA